MLQVAERHFHEKPSWARLSGRRLLDKLDLLTADHVREPHVLRLEPESEQHRFVALKAIDYAQGRAHKLVMTTTFDPETGKATQWKKGCASPNPGGRPKTRLLSEALRSKLGEAQPDDPQGRTYAEVIGMNLIEIASSQGRSAVAAAVEIADRLEGKARQSIQVQDITKEIEQRSDEDLRFYLEHGHWPEEETEGS